MTHGLPNIIFNECNKILKINKFYCYESYVDDASEIVVNNVEEGINEVKTKYPLINEDDFIKLLKLDPTYNGSQSLGKYGKWILNRYYALIKDKIALSKWSKEKENGSTYPKPTNKSQDTLEDFKKVYQLLSSFNVINKKAKLNIDNIKSINKLEDIINQYKKSGVSDNSSTQKLLDLYRKSIIKGAELVFRCSDWIVITATTLESSKLFGDVTKWCTTSPNGEKYSQYTSTDNKSLLINFDLKNNKLYQFHFESGHFTDENNKHKSFYSIVSNNENVKKFYESYLIQKLEKNINDGNRDLNFNILKCAMSLNKNIPNKLVSPMIKKSGDSIKYINNPSLDLQKEAVDSKWWAIYFIKNPSYDIINYTIEKYPSHKDDLIDMLKKEV